MADLTMEYGPIQGMHVGLDGRIVFDFDGRVHAVGLDLDTATADTLDQIRWTNAAGGITAEIIGSADPADADSRQLAFDLIGPDFGSGDDVGVVLTTEPGGVGQQINLFAGGFQRRLLDQLGRSNFVQLRTISDLEAEVQQFTFLAVPAGNQSRAIGSPFVALNWGGAVLSVSASVNSAGLSVVPVNAAAGSLNFAFQNNPALQNITVTWLSFGND